MMDKKVCIYEKFGHCRLRHDCKFYHPTDICKDDLCEVRNCSLRHPQMCKWFLNFGSCNFGDRCYFDHGKILEKMELRKRIEVLEKMCGELQNKCERVLEESKTVNTENIMLKEETKCLKRRLEKVTNIGPIILEEQMDSVNDKDSKVKKTPVDSSENITFLDKEIKDIRKFVMTERMTSSGIQKSKDKMKDIRDRVENLQINDRNEAVLIGMIEDIFMKLDKTKFSSFKRVAVNEFENFLRVLGVEKQRNLKK